MSAEPGTRSSVSSLPGARLATQVLFLLFMGALVAVSRRYFDLHLGLPGHTGVLWMFLLVTGRAVVRRDGAGVLMGASAAFWGVGIGMSHSLPHNLALYSVTGLGLDLMVRAFRMDLKQPLVAMFAGCVAHGTKFLFILGYASGLALPKNFAVVGTTTAFGYHLPWGALGGLLAGVTLWLASRQDSMRRRGR